MLRLNTLQNIPRRALALKPKKNFPPLKANFHSFSLEAKIEWWGQIHTIRTRNTSRIYSPLPDAKKQRCVTILFLAAQISPFKKKFPNQSDFLRFFPSQKLPAQFQFMLHAPFSCGPHQIVPYCAGIQCRIIAYRWRYTAIFAGQNRLRGFVSFALRYRRTEIPARLGSKTNQAIRSHSNWKSQRIIQNEFDANPVEVLPRIIRDFPGNVPQSKFALNPVYIAGLEGVTVFRVRRLKSWNKQDGLHHATHAVYGLTDPGNLKLQRIATKMAKAIHARIMSIHIICDDSTWIWFQDVNLAIDTLSSAMKAIMHNAKKATRRDKC